MRGTGAAYHHGTGLRAIACCLVAMSVLAGCKQAPPAEKPADVSTLRAEIRALEFLNALALSPEQTQKVIASLDRVDEALAAPLEIREAAGDELLPLLQQRRAALLAGNDVPAETVEKIAQLQGRLDSEPWLGSGGETALSKELRGILSAEQVRLASGAGQARADALEILDGFRSLPPEAFDGEIGPFAADLAADTKGLSAAQIEALFREARTFPADEYVAARDKIAKQLEPAFMPEGETADWLLAQSFADPHILPMLREKAAAAGKAAQ